MASFSRMKQLDSKQRAFVLYAAKVLEAKSSDELDSKIQELTPDELNQLTESFDTIYNQQMDGQTLIARAGAKLNYIKKLNGKCPDGYEVEKFQAGGQTCIKCKTIQTKAVGEAAWMKKGSKVISDIKAEMNCGGKMGCGGKAKKKKKMEKGNKIDMPGETKNKAKLIRPTGGAKSKFKVAPKKNLPDPGAGVVEYDGKRKEYSGHNGKGKALPVDKKTGKHQQGGNVKK